MKLSEHVANYVFEKLTDLQNGATIEDVRKELDGLDTKLQGLSDDEKVKLFEDTPILKSHTDGRVTRALAKKESELTSKFDSERQTYNSTIEELKALTPEKDVETLKKEWLNSDDKDKAIKKQAYEFAKLKADFNAERAKNQEIEKREKRNALIDVAKKELGDRKIPKFFNFDSYIGSDEAETKEKVKQGINDYDEWLKGINASKVGDTTPPDNNNEPVDMTDTMQSIGKF